jgi:hypothetical protein
MNGYNYFKTSVKKQFHKITGAYEGGYLTFSKFENYGYILELVFNIFENPSYVT